MAPLKNEDKKDEAGKKEEKENGKKNKAGTKEDKKDEAGKKEEKENGKKNKAGTKEDKKDKAGTKEKKKGDGKKDEAGATTAHAGATTAHAGATTAHAAGTKEEEKGSVSGKTKDSSSAKAIGSYPMDCSRPETCDMPRSAFAASPSCQPPPAPRSCHFVHSTDTGWQVPTKDRHLRPRPSWRQAARWSATFGVASLLFRNAGDVAADGSRPGVVRRDCACLTGSMQHTACNMQHAAFHVHGELA
jgi:hypothetical protein